MKKSLKIYGWAWVAVIAATLITIAVIAIHPSHHDLARDANNIEKIVKVDLPDIAFSESWDNLDRSASRWDVYEHHGEFVEELSYESTMAMDELCQIDSLRWRKTEDGIYCYYDEGGIDGLYHVWCIISQDTFTISYEVDETEGVFAVLLIALAYFIIFKWGIVLLIIALIKRIKNSKKRQI